MFKSRMDFQTQEALKQRGLNTGRGVSKLGSGVGEVWWVQGPQTWEGVVMKIPQELRSWSLGLGASLRALPFCPSPPALPWGKPSLQAPGRNSRGQVGRGGPLVVTRESSTPFPVAISTLPLFQTRPQKSPGDCPSQSRVPFASLLGPLWPCEVHRNPCQRYSGYLCPHSSC